MNTDPLYKAQRNDVMYRRECIEWDRRIIERNHDQPPVVLPTDYIKPDQRVNHRMRATDAQEYRAKLNRAERIGKIVLLAFLVLCAVFLSLFQ